MNLHGLNIYSVTFVLAACSILYELVIAKTISIIAANTIEAYSLIVGIYLCAMGLGALFFQKKKTKKNLWNTLFTVEILISFFGCVSIFLINFSQMLCFYNFESPDSVFAFFVPSFLVATIIGFLSGIELPLLIAIGNMGSPGRVFTNRVLGADYIGSLAGALLFVWLLLPNLQELTLSLVIAAVNLLVAIAIFMKKGERWYRSKLGGSAVLIIFIFVLLVKSNSLQQYFLKKYYFYEEGAKNITSLLKRMDNFPDIERYSTLYQKIDIVRFPSTQNRVYDLMLKLFSEKLENRKDFPRDYYLFMNRDYQFCSDDEEIYHEYFAHIPIILGKKIPKEVLVLGGGDGLLDRELLKYKDIEHITHVELDKKMIRLARTNPVLRQLNEGSLDNPKVSLIISDAFQYIKRNTKKYDAVFVDFPYPVNFDLSKLFSLEFYTFLKARLKKNGFIAIDSPGSDLFSFGHRGPPKPTERNDWPVYYNTLKSAGFDVIVPFYTNLDFEKTKLEQLTSALKPDISQDELISQIREYSLVMTQGFIFLAKSDENFDLRYKKPPVPLLVLTESRFYKSFEPGEGLSWEEKEEDVNSVMKPVFPTSSFWDIRLPF